MKGFILLKLNFIGIVRLFVFISMKDNLKNNLRLRICKSFLIVYFVYEERPSFNIAISFPSWDKIPQKNLILFKKSSFKCSRLRFSNESCH